MCEYFDYLERLAHLNWATTQAVLEIYGFKVTY